MVNWFNHFDKPEHMNNSIKIDSVFLSFKDHKVLRGANIELKKGFVTGLLGRNGSGKSCFLKIITGQLKAQSKHISFGDKRLINLYKEKGLINYLPQHEFHPKSINLIGLLDYYSIDEKDFFERYELLAKNKSDNFRRLSGGQRRLIEVLLVLESKSKFSILDEPFTHVMPIYIKMISKRITELKSEKGILITDHQYQNVIDTADELFLMNEGRLNRVKAKEDLKFYGYIR